MRLSPAEHRRLRRRARLQRELTGWAFLGPMFFFFVLFLLVPVVGTFWWSTRSGGLLGATTNAGLKNYTTFPQQVDALTAVKNTLFFVDVGFNGHDYAPLLWSSDGTTTQPTSGNGESKSGQRTAPGEKVAEPSAQPKRFHGTAELDPTRVGRDAGRLFFGRRFSSVR